MQFSSKVSEQDSPEEIIRELVDGTGEQLTGAPQLAVLFVTAPLVPAFERVATQIRAALRPDLLIGVTAEGVLGGDVEIERRPGAALLVGSLPGVELRPFHIGLEEWAALLSDEERLQQRVGVENRAQLLLGDPFTTPVDQALERFDQWLHAPTFGGMASASQTPGGNRLLLDDHVFDEGAIGIGFGGAVRIETVVSQGCRPVGRPLVVTRVDEGMVAELGRRPALEVTQELLRSLPPEDQALLQNGLFAGLVINEYQESFQRGDFLVRGVLGANPQTGAIAVGDQVRAGQTLQFHVRDAATAHEDLTELLRSEKEADSPAGALLFSCNGRGLRMFDTPHHDIRTTRHSLPELPVAGFFAMGELGPVGGKSFIHGHTASIALFRPA
jgi:small ligand-binding sensory domain FIST